MTTTSISELVEQLRQRALARVSLKRPSQRDHSDAQLDEQAAGALEFLTRIITTAATDDAAVERVLESLREVHRRNPAEHEAVCKIIDAVRGLAALTASIPPTTAQVVQADREADNALYRKLRQKLSRVHPSNVSRNCPLRLELTYGEIARLSTVILRAHRLAFSHPSCEVVKVVAWLRGPFCQGRHPEDAAFARHVATAIERGEHLTPETVSLKGDRV